MKELIKFAEIKYDDVSVYDEKFNYIAKGTREEIKERYGDYICVSKVDSTDDKRTNILISKEPINFKTQAVSLTGDDCDILGYSTRGNK